MIISNFFNASLQLREKLYGSNNMVPLEKFEEVNKLLKSTLFLIYLLIENGLLLILT